MSVERPKSAIDARDEVARAFASGDMHAAYPLAACMVDGIGGDFDWDGAHEVLDPALAASPAARQLKALCVAKGIGCTPDWAAAVDLRVEHARAGDPYACTELALLWYWSGASIEFCLSVLEVAVRQVAEAGVAAIGIARDRGHAHPLEKAILAQLGQSAHPMTSELERVCSARAPEVTALNLADEVFDDARSALMGWQPPKPAERWEALHQASPSVWRVKEYIPAPVCHHVFAQTARHLKESVVFNPDIQKLAPHPFRKSLSASAALGRQNLLSHAMEWSMASLAGARPGHHERLVTLVYRPGEYYRPHWDFLGEKDATASKELAHAGQRSHTVLVPLLTRHEGGETRFTRAGFSWRGQVGEALVFLNLDETGQPDVTSQHESTPITAGVKALASLWIRQRFFDERTRPS